MLCAYDDDDDDTWLRLPHSSVVNGIRIPIYFPNLQFCEYCFEYITIVGAGEKSHCFCCVPSTTEVILK